MTSATEGTGPQGTYKNTAVYNRIGSAPAGDAFFGTRQADTSQSKSEPPDTRIFKVDSDTFDLTTSAAHVVTARYDGKEYKLDTADTTYRLKRVDPDTIEISIINPIGSPSTVVLQVKGNVVTATRTGTGAEGSRTRL
jgi:hypothetical protein